MTKLSLKLLFNYNGKEHTMIKIGYPINNDLAINLGCNYTLIVRRGASQVQLDARDEADLFCGKGVLCGLQGKIFRIFRKYINAI